jgi:hypothetical protein
MFWSAPSASARRFAKKSARWALVVSEFAVPLIVAAIVVAGCTSSETERAAQTTDNCLYIVKYQGKMIKWYSCETPPAMMTTRLSKGP